MIERDPDGTAADVAIVGAGAAGMMAALAARGAITPREPATTPPDAPRVVLIAGTAKLGLKILVSGGGRCNVTNERVTDADFDTDAPHVVRGLLAAFPAARHRRVPRARGVPLYAEPLGKLFPESDAPTTSSPRCSGAIEDAGVALANGDRHRRRDRAAPRAWTVTLGGRRGTIAAPRVIVATGGKSLPKTGSTGFGFELARRLGHTLDTPLPALTPVLLEPEGSLDGLAGDHGSRGALARAPGHDAGAARGRALPASRARGGEPARHAPGRLGPGGARRQRRMRRSRSRGSQPVTLVADFWTLVRDDSPWLEWRDAAKQPGACLPPAGRAAAGRRSRRSCEDAKTTFQDGRRSLGVALAKHLPRSLVEALVRTSGVNPAREARTITEHRVAEAPRRAHARGPRARGHRRLRQGRGDARRRAARRAPPHDAREPASIPGSSSAARS